MDALEHDAPVWPPPISPEAAQLPYEPLCVPEIHRIDVSTSPTELFWKNIPLVGWAISNYMWKERTQFIVDKVQNQLRLRQCIPEGLWGGSADRLLLVKWLSDKIATNMGWCNAHYIPEDPIYALLWAHEDGLDADFLILEIRDYLHITLPNEEVEGWFNLTLGDVVDILLAKKTNS